MSFDYTKTMEILEEWIVWENNEQPDEGDSGNILIPMWLLTTLGAERLCNDDNLVPRLNYAASETSRKHKKQKCVVIDDVIFESEHEDPLYLTRMAFLEAVKTSGVDLASKVPGAKKQAAASTEETAVAAKPASSVSEATFDVFKGAYAAAATGKLVAEAEKKLIAMVKIKLRSIEGWETLPDHPAYDRLILSLLPVAGRELALRAPEQIRDYGVYAADCTIRYQAVRNVDDLGDTLKEIAGETVGMLMELGAAIQQIDTSSSDMDFSAMAAKLKTKVKA